MSDFNFIGTSPASKSLFNRALIVQSHFPQLQIHGESSCDDVLLMKQALEDFKNGKTEFDCGAAGTVLRFLAFRVSRAPGTYTLHGSSRLFERPKDELQQILGQLGVNIQFEKQCLKLSSKSDWKLSGDGLYLNAERSSQFASALYLNSWKLPFDLFSALSGKTVSSGYLSMTLEFLKSLGFFFKKNENEIFLISGQEILKEEYFVEPDMDCAFAVATFAALKGSATFLNFPESSLQPSFQFVEILKQMNVPVELKDNKLVVKKANNFKGVQANLNDAPDLFPVLSVFTALANQEGVFEGLEHLNYKESKRIEKVAELLKKMKKDFVITETSLTLKKQDKVEITEFSFDSDKDHRLVMAASLAKTAGYKIHIKNMEAVSKSFPDFLKIIQDQDRGFS